MYSIKYQLTCILFLISLSAFSQTNDSTVFLKWKLKPGEVITYKTVMKEIDTANHKDFNVDGMMRLIDPGKDKKADKDMSKVFEQLSKQIQNTDFITRLTEKRKGVVDIELSAAPNDGKTKAPIASDTKAASAQKIMSMMTQRVMLRGAVYEDGSIESFYTKNDQKNLLSTMFQLPAKNIKVGDTWSLDVNFLTADQNFVCDSSFRSNVVTLINIENNGGEHIATIKYDILEYIHGDFNSPMGNGSEKLMMKMTHRGIARFSVEKGRWVFYDATMSLSATGLMNSQTTKRLSLISE